MREDVLRVRPNTTTLHCMVWIRLKPVSNT